MISLCYRVKTLVKGEHCVPYKETQGMQRLDYPHYTKMPYPPKITNETKSDHNFLCPSDRQHKSVPVTIIDPLVNTFSTEISVIFYSFLTIFRPSREPFADVTTVYPQ